MLSQVVQDAINKQVNNEFSASYSYLAMSAFCQRKNFTGCASWLRLQSQEEHSHGMKLIDFLLARAATVKLLAVPGPQVEYASIGNVFEQALAQECEVSS